MSIRYRIQMLLFSLKAFFSRRTDIKALKFVDLVLYFPGSIMFTAIVMLRSVIFSLANLALLVKQSVIIFYVIISSLENQNNVALIFYFI